MASEIACGYPSSYVSMNCKSFQVPQYKYMVGSYKQSFVELQFTIICSPDGEHKKVYIETD